MNKKCLTFALLALSCSAAQSNNSIDPYLMNVRIVNIGSENCVLQNVNLKAGSLNPASSFPQMLSANGMPAVFQMMGPKPKEKHWPATTSVDLSLTYNCGAYKTFTLYMKQYFKKDHYHGTLEATMQNAVDVFQTHAIVSPRRQGYYQEIDGNKSGTVSWVISN